MTKIEAKPTTAAVNELFTQRADGLRGIVRAVMQEVLENEMTDAKRPSSRVWRRRGRRSHGMKR